jgi:hypothetical protein
LLINLFNQFKRYNNSINTINHLKKSLLLILNHKLNHLFSFNNKAYQNHSQNLIYIINLSNINFIHINNQILKHQETNLILIINPKSLYNNQINPNKKLYSIKKPLNKENKKLKIFNYLLDYYLIQHLPLIMVNQHSKIMVEELHIKT